MFWMNVRSLPMQVVLGDAASGRRIARNDAGAHVPQPCLCVGRPKVRRR